MSYENMGPTGCYIPKERIDECKHAGGIRQGTMNCWGCEWFGEKRNPDTTGNGGSTPKQYGIPDGATELQDLIEHRDMNFAIGNVFKACYRMGIKNKAEYDLNKIIYFANRELKRIKDAETT